MAPGFMPSPRRDDILLSPNAPGGGDSSISLASSSMTHSVTGLAPRASMTENSANAISVCRGPKWSGVPTTSSLECGAGGVSPPRVFPTHPLPQNGNLDEKMRRMEEKQLLSGSSCLEALGADPSSSRNTPGSEVNDPADPVPDTSMPQQS